MTSTSSIMVLSRNCATLAIVAAALAGCSTVKSIVPTMGSSVPYANQIKPTIPQPAVVEVPAFKAAPKPPPKPAEPPPEPAAAEPAKSPAPAAAPSAPAAAQPESKPAAEAPQPAPPKPQSSLPRQDSPRTAEAAPAPAKPLDKSAQAQPQESGDNQPSIPEERRAFNDDGKYPNLAQVPARPVNLPTFADAASLEKLLQADSAAQKQKDLTGPSAASTPATAAASAKASAAGGTATASAAPAAGATMASNRAEDRGPCLSQAPVSGDPTVTVHFRPGSSAMTADELAVLVEALPTVRTGSGTIRIFGHGDTDRSGVQTTSRFDLAVARAGAVALALAGYGIPTPRMAVGVACADTAMAGASVQLYAES